MPIKYILIPLKILLFSSILSGIIISTSAKDRLPHTDHIEMSGEKVSVWVRYGLDSIGRSDIFRTVVFPTFRLLPDATRSHISYSFSDSDLPRIYVNNRLINLQLVKNGPGRTGELSYNIKSFSHKGIMKIGAQAGTPALVNVERTIFPSVDKPLVLETFVIKNITDQPVNVYMEYLRKEVRTDAKRSKGQQHSMIVGSVNDGTQTIAGAGTGKLLITAKGKKYTIKEGVTQVIKL